MGVGVGIIWYIISHRHAYVVYNEVYEYTFDNVFWSKKEAEKFLKYTALSEGREEDEYVIEKWDVH